MSLHEFLREGGEVSYRIMNRLSHLIQNLDISGSPFPFSPGSRKNSWRDWDGKTKRGGGFVCVCVCVSGYVYACVQLFRVHMTRFCVCACGAGHHAQSLTQSFLWASLASPLGRFCVFVCITVLCQCECVTVQLKQQL